MQGTIAFDGTLSGSIAGGGGGSEVTITPTLTEGEKIADFEIDGSQGELYAPTPTPLPEHIVNDIHGFSYTPYPATEIARYTIDDGVEQSLYGPDYKTTWEAYPGVDQDYTIGLLKCYGSTYNVKIPNYQKPLTAGANITINPVTNEISASGTSSWDYSTSEVDTGQKWIDGKTIYCKVINSTLTGTTTSFNIPNVSTYIKTDGYVLKSDNTYSLPLTYYETSVYKIATEFDYTNSNVDVITTTTMVSMYPNVVLICYYTKTS